MKVLVNDGRVVHTCVKAGTGSLKAGTAEHPTVKVNKPGNLIDLPDEEARDLIARGAVTKYEPPKVAETPKAAEPEKPAK